MSVAGKLRGRLARGRELADGLWLRASGYRDLVAETLRGAHGPEGIGWLLIATLPNSGSTALAQLLATAPAAMLLRRDGEGQWLVPHLCAPARRWDPAAPVAYPLVRAVWTARARAGGLSPVLVVDKSPPSLVRMRPLARALAPMPVWVARFSRDPYAICASWAKRYSPDRIARQWRRGLVRDVATEAGYYAALGGLCGERMALMAGLDGLAGLDLSYEALTADPAAAAVRLTGFCPPLAGLDPAAAVRVKDYAPQPLRNMNDEQTGRLSDAQIGWISEGLRPYQPAVTAAGYLLR